MARKKKNRGYVGRFSGKEYPEARGLGDYQYEPQAGSWQRSRLAVIQQILRDNADYLPLRPRAILYRLMGKRLATKADDGRVTDLIASARRSGYIAWEDIDDGRTVTFDIGGYDDPSGFWNWAGRYIERSYRRKRRQGQKWWIELWVESAGYLPVLQRTAATYGAKLVSGSGFNPILEIRKSALAASKRYIDSGQRTVIFYLGDYDDSGITRIDRTDADMRQFFIDNEGGDDATFESGGKTISARAVCEYIIKSEWLGLRPEQAVDLGLLDADGNPAEEDTAEDGKFELEAVEPADVVDWVEEAFERYTDMDVLAATEETAKAERERMVGSMKRLAKRWKAA
jgi:hypothetical protein